MRNLAEAIDSYEIRAERDSDPIMIAYYIGCAEGIRQAIEEYERRIRGYSELAQELIDETL